MKTGTITSAALRRIRAFILKVRTGFLSLSMWLSKRKALIVSLCGLMLIYYFLYAAMGQQLLSHSSWDSYTKQARAWWMGRAHLEENYSYLELAQYKGRIYVSFPPLPSAVQFFLVPFFGADTPNNLLVTLYGLGSFLTVYALGRKRGLSGVYASFWGLFLTIGGNLAVLTVNGGVWFQAQALAYLLSLLSVYFIFSDKKSGLYLSFMFLALSVGCRPFNILYFPLLLLVYFRSPRGQEVPEVPVGHVPSAAVGALRLLIAPALIGCVYAAYNYLRFDSVVEFGHNYLPEFLQHPTGQFHIGHIFSNMPNMFRLPTFRGTLIDFPKFNGFAFFIANPLFLVYGARLFSRRSRCHLVVDAAVVILTVLHLLLITSHRTLGGWHFGNRYTVDILPFLLVSMFSRTKEECRPGLADLVCFSFGAVLNIYGTLWMFLDW
ncbi:MAG: hypothetical protein JXB03_00365 [Spirochaetales bacterium]|nr:hypothetical protein [Spirochaetales bacterium]